MKHVGGLETLKFISKKKFYIFIIINQSDIGKGYNGVNNFIKLQKNLKNKLLIRNIFINIIVYSSDYKKNSIKKFSVNCTFRKLDTEMFKYLKENCTINIKKSLFICNNITEKICAQKSNINFIFYNKYLYKNIKKYIKSK